MRSISCVYYEPSLQGSIESNSAISTKAVRSLSSRPPRLAESESYDPSFPTSRFSTGKPKHGEFALRSSLANCGLSSTCFDGALRLWMIMIISSRSSALLKLDVGLYSSLGFAVARHRRHRQHPQGFSNVRIGRLVGAASWW